MKKYLLIFLQCLLFGNLYSQVQITDIHPNTGTRNQTLTTTITMANAQLTQASPPYQTPDLYLEQNGYIIISDYFDASQLYINNGNWDSLYVNFTIPGNAPTGSYDVHVVASTAGPFPWDPPIPNDLVLPGAFLISSSATCLVPYTTSASAITNTTVQINWSTYTLADTFRIRYYPVSTGVYQYLDVNGSGGVVNAPLSGLTPGTLYEYQVSSICGGISGGYSAVDNFTTLPQAVNCIVPFALSSSGLTNTSATVNWSPLVTADTFIVRYSVNGTGNYLYQTLNGTLGSSATLNGLQPAVTYQFQVSSICLGVSNGYSASATFTTTGTCVIPVGLSLNGVTNTTASIAWSTNVTADTFMIRYFKTGTILYSYMTVNGAAHTATLTGLDPGTSYQFQVSSICLGNSSGYSTAFTFSTNTIHILCAKPYDVTVSNILNTSAQINWTPYVDADTFRIRYSINGTANFLYKNINGGLPHSGVLTQLQAATTYMVQVSSVCSGQGSNYSIPVFFVTASTPDSCSRPYGLSSSLVTNTTAQVNWSIFVLADTFMIRYAINGSGNYIWKTVNGSLGHSTSLTGLQPATTYQYQVSSICNGVSSGYSVVSQFVTQPTPVACVVPWGLTNSNTTNVSTTVSWTPYVTADTFRIRYREFGTFTYSYLDVSGAGGTTAATISNLDPNTFYTYQVSSICTGVSSGYSPAAFFSTLNIAINCARPYGVSTSNVTNSSALVSWNNLVTADTFRLRYSVNGSLQYRYLNSPGTAGNSVVLSGLLPNTNYQVQVSSICTGSSSGYSFSSLFTTANTPVACITPYGLTTSNISATSADINWTPLVTADSFMIRYSVNGTTNYSWLQITGAGGVSGTTLTGLTTSTIYQWQVRSICAGVVTSIYSTSAIFTTNFARMANPNPVSLPSSIELYPNPAHESVTLKISVTQSEKGELRITDLNGKLVYSSEEKLIEGENRFELNTSGFSKGMYIVHLKTSSVNEHLRLLIE